MHTTTAPDLGARRLDRLLAHYGESHQNAVNERIHLVAVPAIMLSLTGLLYTLHPWFATAVLVGSLFYYATLGSPLLLGCMVGVSALLYAGASIMGEHLLLISAFIFVLAWIFQFIGHKVEGRKPSFFEDLQYLLVDPLFVLARLFPALPARW